MAESFVDIANVDKTAEKILRCYELAKMVHGDQYGDWVQFYRAVVAGVMSDSGVNSTAAAAEILDRANKENSLTNELKLGICSAVVELELEEETNKTL